MKFDNCAPVGECLIDNYLKLLKLKKSQITFKKQKVQNKADTT